MNYSMLAVGVFALFHSACTVVRDRPMCGALRVPWKGIDEVVERLGHCQLGSDSDGPLLMEIQVPDDIADDDLSRIQSVLDGRGYLSLHTSPSVVAEVSDFWVLMALPDPV